MKNIVTQDVIMPENWTAKQNFTVYRDAGGVLKTLVDAPEIGYKAYNCWLLDEALPDGMTPKTLVVPRRLFSPFFQTDAFIHHNGSDALIYEIGKWIIEEQQELLAFIKDYFSGCPLSVRSSADEDLIGSSSAGRYLSVLDVQIEDTAQAIAEVLASYHSPNYFSDIPALTYGCVMIQEMIGTQESRYGSDDAPFVPASQIHLIARLTKEISAKCFDGQPIDTEWIIKGATENISCVAFSTDPNGGTGFSVVTASFGAGSVVNGGSPNIATYYVNADNNTPVFLKSTPTSTFQHIEGDLKLFALQARPTVLTKLESCQHTVVQEDENTHIIPVEVLVRIPQVTIGKVLLALTIEAAWFRWQSLPEQEQPEYATVAVLNGTMLDHYAILFREKGVCVVRVAAVHYRDLSALDKDKLIVDCEQRYLIAGKYGLADIEVFDGPSKDISRMKDDWRIIMPPVGDISFAALKSEQVNGLLNVAKLIKELRNTLSESLNDIVSHFKKIGNSPDPGVPVPDLKSLSSGLRSLDKAMSSYYGTHAVIGAAGYWIKSCNEISHAMVTCLNNKDFNTAIFYGRVLYRLFYGFTKSRFQVKKTASGCYDVVSFEGFDSLMNEAFFLILYTLSNDELIACWESNWMEWAEVLKPMDAFLLAILITKVSASPRLITLMKGFFPPSIRNLSEFVSLLERPYASKFERQALHGFSERLMLLNLKPDIHKTFEKWNISKSNIVPLAILEQGLESDIFYPYCVTDLPGRASDERLKSALDSGIFSGRDIERLIAFCGGDGALNLLRNAGSPLISSLYTQITALVLLQTSQSVAIGTAIAQLKINDHTWINRSVALGCEIADRIRNVCLELMKVKEKQEDDAFRNTCILICHNSLDNVVDLFDNAGKVLCLRLTEKEESVIEYYLFVLKKWCQSLLAVYASMDFEEGLKRLEYFQCKIRDLGLSRPTDIGLDERSWKNFVFKRPELPLNFHQLHNAIHQSELELRATLFPIGFPSQRIQQILSIANRFSFLPNKLQRVKSSLIELDLALSRHKSLCLLSAGEISFEFIELSSLRFNIGKIIARLYAIQYWLPLIYDKKDVIWNCHIEEVLNEYQLRINIFPSAGNQFSYEAMADIFSRIKTLFDCMHRFARCPNHLVLQLKERNNVGYLKEIFNLILDYCSGIDYSSRRNAVRRNYCSCILTYVSLHPGYFEQIHRNMQAGFESFLQFVCLEVGSDTPFVPNYYRPWKTMNKKRVLLLFLCMKFPVAMSEAYDLKRKELSIFNKAEITELLYRSNNAK